MIIIGSGNHLFQFVHVDDLCEVSIQSCLQEKSGLFNVGAEKFGTLREDLTALIHYAGKTSRVRSVPPGLAIGALATLDKLNLSPLGPWHYLTYHKPFYFDISPVKKALGWQPKYSNQEILSTAYDWFTSHKRVVSSDATSFHKAPVKQGILRLLKGII